jgi:NADH-quinone oxidoreductase subunit L
MLELLWLIPVLPLAGFVVLAIAGARLSRSAVAVVGVGSVGLSAVVMVLVAIEFLGTPPPGHVYSQTIWIWLSVGSFAPAIAFYLDALSLVMIFVITFVGFLIHLYSTEFMIDDEGYSRVFLVFYFFFCLFV